MTTTMSKARADQLIADEFGVNADYVSELLAQFERDPSSVDEEWRAVFEELLDNGRVPTESLPVEPAPAREGATAGVIHATYEWGSHEDDDGAKGGRGDGATQTPAPETAPEAAAPSPLPSAPQETPHVAPKGVDAVERIPIRGPALRIAENMEASLAVPTATSQRQVPLKLLDENRRLINQYVAVSGRKVSYTHIVARAILKALESFPQLNDSFEEADDSAYRVRHSQVNFGVAVDVTKKDGARTLLVPNIKGAEKLSFPQLLDAYDDIVKRARGSKLQVSDFQGTTISLTNPGTIGTTASNPRLMAGQSVIVATGAIAYPPEYQAMSPDGLSRIGISKVMTITSTYDHRIVQGAESGAFLALIDELLRGGREFYDQIFADLGIRYRPYRWSMDINPAILGEERRRDAVRKQARVFELINAFRVRGHLIADLDPLGWQKVQYHPELDIETYELTIWDLDRQFITSGVGGTKTAPLREIVDHLHDYYCGKVGIEYRNIQGPEEKEWIRARVEIQPPPVPVEARKQILWKLISAELFERFLGTKYLGQKRFSIEGNETVIAVLDQLIESAARREIDDITIGMAHRGRLNVIANVIGKFCERIFTSFEGSIHPKFPHDQGDVKYHQGASGIRETADGREVALAVVPNPSHLEFVNPVVEGIVRARQDVDGERSSRLAVLLHGDAAFAGEGIVAETLNLSQLPGYTTGGTIHIIVNNQLGFTTPPEEGRSSTYSTDIAKMIQAPIFHVNSDDVEGAYNVLQIALDYRQTFKKDVVIDVIGFRKLGHNEGDEPSYTQPVMYQRIREHPGARALYARKLIADEVMTEEDVATLMDERNRRYENAQLAAKAIVEKQGSRVEIHEHEPEHETVEMVETGVDQHTLRTIAHAITTVPRGFNLNPKIVGLLARRAKMVEGEANVDWGMAEALAFGSLLGEGTPVRLTGQDTVRGTFSHRHAAFTDTQTGAEWAPLSQLAGGARYEIYDSPLSEAGALGFEYGYSVASRPALVLWEAQFGDFINAAQVIVDQFIASGEEKWNQPSGIVLLLPHGYEGQGSEHSSARLERFLQLCAEGNMQVVNCSTAAQYFHVLRRQARQGNSKPLIVMTPKSLLRLPEAASPIEQFTTGGFLPVITDKQISDKQSDKESDKESDNESDKLQFVAAAATSVTRVVLCSGKVYYDLVAARKKLENSNTAIIRVEQFYPFPKNLLTEELSRYSNATEIRWVQEEPENMGGWSFMHPRLLNLLSGKQTLRYIGRPASASPATGSHTIHQMEQQRLVKAAL
ncbi:MAG TPA: multifunctional oxoglutarate decarboxylase/oxoglutarate dehydrogenase thiamine pyrophosphate-binding subunit/dihydrolipoyllysine-residue succinyltransferase subunit [Blastocatellia bacterium]|nr:multifunctional oxoglutarate decarboxylase/oxoglutarate dehydrogenase thiamine pyrophosphate-binding subunit/dihydrolipoyllysine-residue succinyltransferase subunit [Blastocatellia bacterium]